MYKRQVAIRYEDAGLFDKAGKVVRGLLIDNPYDTELLLRLALIEEKKGDLSAAGIAYEPLPGHAAIGRA